EIALALGKPELATPSAPPPVARWAQAAPAPWRMPAPSIPPAFPAPTPAPPDFEARDREAILAAILQAGGNKVLAAKILGISRRTLYRKIDRYGI
ncbi:MAG: hypothetical protein KKC37_17030, partial [Proteobacteria bacterium]|nr:hypothetical protein [Pseudomonadota bacterium]